MHYPVIDPVATGDRINMLRKKNGYSVAYLRDYLGLSTTNAIYKWFHGESLPSIDNFLILSALFGISINEMLIYH